ncbi:T9SS type A sorting domain-containing protein [Chryseosolibacter indicus]|uniref:T9SS type A sorting domain-containing protein n=1 Tax=Chryseosolibacter indicus TaxID=2782351 RepID=A0ABS5VUG6_9BACT|nr:T9SS type A sorting domain-containing protein [Chryseosolibacter indicus]MBT1704976.1 T9SS type A sorting domain-containing protein [Chryseosolibacter indicus]
MRLVKFFGIIIIGCMAHLGLAQSQPENSYSPEVSAAQSVELFPNPAVEYLDVTIQHLPVGKVRVAVHNILGNPMPIETEIIDEHRIRVRVKDLAAGYYLLAVKDDDSKFKGAFKFLKR